MRAEGALVAAAIAMTAVALAAIAVQAAGLDVGAAFHALFSGAFGDARRIGVTLLRATPLLLTGLAVGTAFRAGLWNIGAEGQLIVGAVAATWVGTRVDLGAATAVPTALAAGCVAGALWGLMAGALRALRSVPEVIATILLNFVAMETLSWSVQGPLREAARRYPQTDPVAAAFVLPPLGLIPCGLAMGCGVAFLLHLVLARTRTGVALKLVGANPRAAALAGVRVPLFGAMVLAASGGLAGLAGAVEVQGSLGRLYEGYAPGHGFAAIPVALLARLEPLLAIPSALFFGALAAGCERMEALAGVPAVVSSVVQAVVVLGSVLAGRRERVP